MAEIKKFPTAAVRGVFIHANRTADDGHSHSNESIDISRTKYNYRLKTGGLDDWKKRLEEVWLAKRKNSTTFCEAVITLPRDVKPEDERQFFQAAYEFFSGDFGENNIMYAVVHKDETTPHLHLGFVPVTEMTEYRHNQQFARPLREWAEKHDGQMPQEKVCARDVVGRPYLRTMHERLQKFIDTQLEYHVSIINGATVHGNKTVLELKVKTLQEKEEALRKSITGIRSEAEQVARSMAKTGVTADSLQLYPLLHTIEALQEQNKVLMEIITRNGCTYNPNEIRKKESAGVTLQSAGLYIYEGSLVDEQLADNAVVIIEIPKDRDESPQQKLINADFDLRQIVAFAKSSSDEVKVRRSRTSDKTFVTVKTDGDEQHTIANLILLERLLREIEGISSKKIYMDRIESDRYDLAKSILASNDFQTAYFEKKSIFDKFAEEAREQEINETKE